MVPEVSGIVLELRRTRETMDQRYIGSASRG